MTLSDIARIRALNDTMKGKALLAIVAIVTIELVYFILAQGGLHHLFIGGQALAGSTFGLEDIALSYLIPTGFIVLLTCLVPNTSSIFSYIGKNTFPIFLYHPLFTLLLEKFPIVQLNFLESCLFAALIIALILGVQELLRKGRVVVDESLNNKKTNQEVG